MYLSVGGLLFRLRISTGTLMCTALGVSVVGRLYELSVSTDIPVCKAFRISLDRERAKQEDDLSSGFDCLLLYGIQHNEFHIPQFVFDGRQVFHSIGGHQ